MERKILAQLGFGIPKLHLERKEIVQIILIILFNSRIIIHKRINHNNNKIRWSNLIHKPFSDQ